VVNLAECTNNARVVDTRNEHSRKVCQECRLLLKIERQGFIVTNEISNR